MKTVLHNGLTCDFDEKVHSYKVGDEFLESVTTYKKSFFPEFDTQKQAVLYSKRHNVPLKSVLEDWEQKGYVGRLKGQNLHFYAEKLLKKEPFSYTQHIEYKPVLEKLMLGLMDKFTVFGVEYIVFSLSLKLAGTLDAILVGKDIVMLLDWKTDKAIKLSNSWDRAYPPFSHMDACNFNEYAVQLNLYQYILEKEGYFPPWVTFMKRIVHLTNGKATWYKIPDLQPQIASIFN